MPAEALTPIRRALISVSDKSGLAGLGRVKTLHPKVHGGILACRDLASHRAAMTEHERTRAHYRVRCISGINLYNQK